MISDLKMSFKLLRYGINLKSNIAFALVIFVVGFVMDLGQNSVISAIYMSLVSIYFGQIAHSVVQSTMVQTSPHKKMMQTKAPALVMTVVTLVYNTLRILWRFLLVHMNVRSEGDFLFAMIIEGGLTIIFLLYFSFAMKLYWLATICFFLAFYPVLFGIGFSVDLIEMINGLESSVETLPIPIIIAFSYVCILLGGIMNYGVSILLYKKDYSKLTFQKALDRAK